MPIYEFYCADCHTVFNFRSTQVNTDKRPACPRCERLELERQVSRFAISKGRQEEESDDPFAGVDESRMERAFESMASEMEGIDENDPRQAAGMMRKLFDATGLECGPSMEEAMKRMEAGEDPDQIEHQLGDALEGEADLMFSPKKQLNALRRRLSRPQVDDRLYDL